MKSPWLEAPRWKPAHTWVVAIIFLGLVLTASGIELWVSYHNVIDKTKERAETTSSLIAEWLSTSFSFTARILQDVVSDLDPAEIRYPNPDPDRHARRTAALIRKAKTDPTILFLGFFDAQCTVTHTSIGFNLGKNFKHRDYCRLAFQYPSTDFKVSSLFVASDNKMNVTIVYPILAASQDTIGFAAMGLDLNFFQQWLDRLKPMHGLVVSIFDNKQQLLARLPLTQKMIGKTIDAPILKRFSASSDPGPLSFRDVSLVDGSDRVWTIHRVHNLPFFVVTGLPADEALTNWWMKFVVYYLLGNLTLTTVLLFGVLEFNRNHQLAQRMAVMAGTDSLTGLANRHRFMETAAFRFEEARRYRQSFAILLMDIDHFKQVNDRYGHSIGDAVLRAFADTLQHTARFNDCMARWGGEEFIALLPNTDQQMATKLAERVRTLTTEIAIEDVRVTVSIGISEYRQPETLDALIKRADEALYLAKQQGRDQVRIAP
jgi:diguanylate cyclase (GGDEF)-like protein